MGYNPELKNFIYYNGNYGIIAFLDSNNKLWVYQGLVTKKSRIVKI